MTDTTHDLAALIGSRICHDLISPLGAIGNGVELLSLACKPSEEVTLISESVANAAARIRFFRVAYGASVQDQHIARNEFLSILQDYQSSNRVQIYSTAGENLPRAIAKLILLLVQCFETAMPFGGTIRISQEDERWKVSGCAEKLRVNSDLWEMLSTTPGNGDVRPADVQFAIVPQVVSELGRSLTLKICDQGIDVIV